MRSSSGHYTGICMRLEDGSKTRWARNNDNTIFQGLAQVSISSVHLMRGPWLRSWSSFSTPDYSTILASREGRDIESPQLRFVPRIMQLLGYMPYYATLHTLGERIVATRRLLGLTQKELAHRLGVDPSALGRWEKDEGRPSKRLLKRLTALISSLPSDAKGS